MAYNAGDVEAKLTLDRSPFITGLQESRREAERFERRTYKAKLSVEDRSAPVVTAMQRRLTTMAAKTYKPKVRLDIGTSIGQLTQLQNRLNTVARRRYTAEVRVGLGTSIGEITKLKTALQGVNNRGLKLTLDVTQAYRELMRFAAAYRQIAQDKHIRITAKADTAPAMTNLRQLNLMAANLARRRPTITVNANTGKAIGALYGLAAAQNSASNAADRHTRRIIAMTVAITGAAAPAVGLLSALLLTLPTVALMAGAAIGSIALGIDGIKRAAATLSPQMDALKASVSATFERGLLPVFQQLAAVFPVLTTGMNGQAQALVGWAAAFSNVVTQAQGLNQLTIIFQGLNQFITDLTPSVTNMTQAFMTLGVVGTQNLWALSGALNSWTAGFNAMIQQAQNTGLLASAFQQLGFVVGALLGLLNQLFLTGMQAMSAIGPNMTYAVNALSNAIRALTPTLITLAQWFFNLVGVVLNTAAALADYLGPALPYVIGGMVALWGVVQGIQLAMKVWAGIMVLVNGVMMVWRAVTVAATIVQWGLNAALLANPIGLVVAAVLLLIAALVALGYGIYKLIQNWDTVVKFMVDGWNWILDTASRVIDAIVNFFASLPSRIGFALGYLAGMVVRFFIETIPAWTRGAAQWISGLAEGLVNNWPQILGWFATLPSQIMGFFANAAVWLFQVGVDILEGLVNGLWSAAVYVWNAITQFVTSFIAGFKSALGISSPSTVFAAIGVNILEGLIMGLQTMVSAVINFFSFLSTSITTFFSNAWLTMREVAISTWTYIAEWLQERLNAFSQVWNMIWQQLSGLFISIWQGIQNIAITSWNTLATVVTQGVQVFTTLWNSLWQNLSNLFVSIWQGIQNIAITTWNTIASLLTAGVNAFAAVWSAAWNAIQLTVTVVWNAIVSFLTAGVNAFSAFWTSAWNAVAAVFASIWQTISSTATTVWNAISSFLIAGLNSFSAVWSSIWTAISNFFTSVWQGIQNTAVSIWNSIASFLTGALNAFASFWSGLWNSVLAAFTQIWNSIQSTAVSIWNSINSFYVSALNAFSSFWSGIWNAILAFFTTTWQNIFSTGQIIWNNLNSFFTSSLNAFSSFWTGAWNGIRDAFGSAFGGIIQIANNIWTQLKGIFTTGVNAIIRGVNWPIEKINGAFGIKIPVLPPLGALATGGNLYDSRRGGPVHGPGTSTNDRVLTRLSNQEHVWSAKEVRAAGGHDAVRRMRSAVLNPNSAAAHVKSQAQAAAPSRRSMRAIMAMQARTMAPRDLGSGWLSGLQRRRLMDKNPILDDFGVPGLAPGGVRPHVAAASDEVERLFGRMPGGVGGLGARSGPSDHPRGLALDFMTMSNRALGDRVANHLLSQAGRLGIKYLIWLQRINSGSGWRGMENRGSPTANHMDHVHASFHDRPGTGGAFAGGGAAGGFFEIDWGAMFDSIAGPFKALGLAALKGFIPDTPVWMEPLGESIYNKAWDGMRNKAIEMIKALGAMFGMGGAGNPAIGAPGMGPGGAVERWRPLVLAALARQGQPAGLADRVLMQIRSESGGNPNAVNNWDINARRGTPSGGLLQTIAPTFARYRDPGLPNNMFDPFANINASIRYALARYGSLNAAYRGVGYDHGGLLPKGVSVVHNATGANEHMAVFDNGDWATLKALVADSGHNLQTVNYGGIGREELVAIMEKFGNNGPTIGTLAPMLPNGANVHEVIREIMFRLRHYRTSARYK